MLDLGGLEVGRDEDVRRQPHGRGGSGGRTRQVAGRGTGQRLDAEVEGSRGGDRDGAVLEAQRRVAGVVLDPQPVDAQHGREPVGGEERRGPHRQRPRRRRLDGEQLQVAPDARRASGDRLAGQGGAGDREVVGHLERPEAGGTHVGEPERLGATAVPACHPADAPGPIRQGRRCGGGRCGCRRRRLADGRCRRWEGLAGHRSGLRGMRTGHAARGTGMHGTTLIARRGLRGVPLSRRRTCPELAPCRLRAGRLSWLHRAGPSATLDKRSSVVGGCYVPVRCSVKRRSRPSARERAAVPRDNVPDTVPQPAPGERGSIPGHDCGSRLLRAHPGAHHARPVDP